jgi:SAM-dependent methyltransferase
MHYEARKFTIFIKETIPEAFINKKVLDVGSGDINGNNRFLFTDCEYHGNDVIAAPNVTIVSKTKDLPFPSNSFDTIISTECFEHDPEYVQSFLKIYDMLKSGGIFIFTCASTGRAEHGTRRTSPYDSYGSIGNLDDMHDYYKNLTIQDIQKIQTLDSVFSIWDSYYNNISKDLYFIGIKKEIHFTKSLPEYEDNGVNRTHYIETLDTIFNKYNTDKNTHFHNYTRQYDNLLRDFRDKPIKYLEIGVFTGESLNAFREAFLNAKCIVGVDIDNYCKNYENGEKNIFVEIGNATDPNFIKLITEKYGSFDIILDDGSHKNMDVINAFELLFPLLNDNGLYIVEDTICYKSRGHIAPHCENHLEYFFKYTKYLNQWRYDSTNGIRDNCIDPFKIMKKTNNIFEYSIDKIEYGCSYIAISKKIRHHWI